MLYQQGQYEQGIIFAQQTCDLAKSYSLTNEPIYADSLNNLALLYKSIGKYEQALSLYQQVLLKTIRIMVILCLYIIH